MKEYVGWIGIVSGVLTAVSMLPQLLKIIKEKKAVSISYWMLGVLLAGICGWVWYGILKEDKPVMMSNAVSLLLNIITLIFTIKYREKEA